MLETQTMQIADRAAQLVVCVDQFKDREASGRLIYTYGRQLIFYRSTLQMLREMERSLNSFEQMQPSFRSRTFGNTKIQRDTKPPGREARPHMQDDTVQVAGGEKATFVVQIQFRQNATWQGMIQWMNQKKSEHFRSALEMIKLMDEALSQAQGNEESISWTPLCGNEIDLSAF